MAEAGNTDVPQDMNAREFRLEEYKSLREEVQKRTDRQVNLEIYIIFALAVIYGFLLTTPEQKFPANVTPWLWWIPVLLLITGFLRWWSNHSMITRIATYLRDEHETFVKCIDPSYCGWETYNYPKRGQDKITVVLMWIGLILLASVGAALLPSHLLGTKP